VDEPVGSKGSAGSRTSLSPALAATAYLAITLAMTWPLVLGLGRDIPGDLGDSLLNCWILGWDGHRLLPLLQGELGALKGFWNANIFYPEPLALAYSEHLLPQALEILPVYALTGNLILCYNLLFLSTFVLSGLGVFLLVRDLTGRGLPAFIAGLIYAFTPYRVAQFSHIQVLSSQWMPFVLFGLRRYFHTQRLGPLVGASLALLAQNLSCGYFLLYFAPFVGAYVVFELGTRRRLRDFVAFRHLALAGLGVAALTLASVWPYLELRARGDLSRPRWEVERFSADVYSYLTAPADVRLWGEVLEAFPKPEGALFPGVVPLLLGVFALGLHLRRASAQAAQLPENTGPSRPRRAVAVMALVFCLSQLLLVGLVLAGFGTSLSVGPLVVRFESLSRPLESGLAALAVLLIVSTRARHFARACATPVFAFGTAAVLAFWLSLGPTITSLGRTLGTGPYAWLYEHVPGFASLRAPSRFGMLVELLLAVLAGFGALEVEVRKGRGILALLGLAFLLEATAAPIPLNSFLKVWAFRTPKARALGGSEAPGIYLWVSKLPKDAVVAEFPFGSPAYDVRYMFYSTRHWRRLLNGYSGIFPPSYPEQRQVLGPVLEDPDKAWGALRGSGATHVIVHESAYRHDEGALVSAWLASHGSRCVARIEDDALFEVSAEIPVPP
jgi:hypothetical protein